MGFTVYRTAPKKFTLQSFYRQGFEFPGFFQLFTGGLQNFPGFPNGLPAQNLRATPGNFSRSSILNPPAAQPNSTPFSPPPALFVSRVHHHHHHNLHLPAPRRLLGRALGLHPAAHAPSPARPPPLPPSPVGADGLASPLMSSAMSLPGVLASPASCCGEASAAAGTAGPCFLPLPFGRPNAEVEEAPLPGRPVGLGHFRPFPNGLPARFVIFCTP
jgi:hypothetical protein